MAVHKLFVDDFQDESFILLGIHCSLQDFRLAYLINNALQINLERKPNDLDYKYTSAFFAIYEWEDKSQQVVWNLVANICKKEEEALTSSGLLFNNNQRIIKEYNLLPEHKTVNFLLKIENDFNTVNEKLIINKILAIPQIVTVYQIVTDNLKSSSNLIFN
jgi:hypothetical protein